jgi:5-methylcytosine-specific restriction enzyme subunit McrC
VTRRTIPLVERRTRVVKLPRAEVDFLLGHARNIIEVTPTFERRVYRLTARGHVGFMDGPELRYAVAPKIPWPNLLMLLGATPDRGGDVAGTETAEPEGGLLGALATEFVDQLNEVVRIGLVAGYGEAEAVSTFLRGKLRTADQMRDVAARAFPDRFHVDEPVFDLHTPWNRVPKATASALLRRGGLPETIRRRVETAALPLATVPDVPATEADFAAALAEPRVAAYRPLLEVCRLILSGLNVANPLGTAGGAFLVDLGRAFERYLTTALEHAFVERPSWVVEEQPRFTLGETDFQPDILVRQNGQPRAVLDAKWKTATPEAADLHQVLAYSTVTGAAHVGLVYPGLKYGRGHCTTPDGRVRVSLFRVRVVGSADELERSVERLARALRSDGTAREMPSV